MMDSALLSNETIPNSPGYIREDDGITIGFMKNGLLETWGIKYYNKKFVFGYWVYGVLKRDLSPWMYWIRVKMGENAAKLDYTDNLIQVCNEEDGYIRLGVPGGKLSGTEILNPGNIGFEFHKNGVLYVGEREPVAKYFDGIRFEGDSYQFGVFNDDKLIRPLELENYQSSEYIWYDEGMLAKKRLHTPYDDLPF